MYHPSNPRYLRKDNLFAIVIKDIVRVSAGVHQQTNLLAIVATRWVPLGMNLGG